MAGPRTPEERPRRPTGEKVGCFIVCFAGGVGGMLLARAYALVLGRWVIPAYALVFVVSLVLLWHILEHA
ncbi:MAG: hypothetical protein M5U01_11335 [Ardenticatenaceae bacterium]|nr:hypothetical protein [Ardenticatenaceae bacterium]HBY99194.1 hypothetical protein [Chloroflexota bacterium]